MRGGLTNIYTYLWLVVDARQPGILDGPNSLPKQGIWPAILAWRNLESNSGNESLSWRHIFPAFWGKIGGFSALLNIIKKYIFNISLLLFFLNF